MTYRAHDLMPGHVGGIQSMSNNHDGAIKSRRNNLNSIYLNDRSEEEPNDNEDNDEMDDLLDVIGSDALDNIAFDIAKDHKNQQSSNFEM